MSFFVVLPSFPSFLQVGLLCPLLLFGGASLPLHSLDGGFWVGLLFPSLLLGGAAWASLFGWCCVWPSLLLRGAAFLLLLLVGLLSLSSSLGWCCLASFVGWCCVIPSLFLRGAAFLHHLLWAGLFQEEKSKNRKKTKLETKNRNKEKQRGKTKRRNQKKEKLKSEFLNPIRDEKVHLSTRLPSDKCWSRLILSVCVHNCFDW